jgi:hypothetical protein
MGARVTLMYTPGNGIGVHLLGLFLLPCQGIIRDAAWSADYGGFFSINRSPIVKY